MDQPGVEVRPIKMITGESEFNEVFFTDARCPKENVVGEVNNGWAVAMTLLGYERGEAAATFPLMFRTELDRLLALAKRARASPTTRSSASGWRGATRRSRSCATSACGRSPSSCTATTRVPTRRSSSSTGASTTGVVTELAVDILGADAMVPSGRWPSNAFQTDDAGRARTTARRGSARSCNARAGTIYAGSIAGPAQHHRRDGARPAEGAHAAVTWPSAGQQSSRRTDRRPMAERGGRGPALLARATAARQVAPTRSPGWWRRRPSRARRPYLRFRMQTRTAAPTRRRAPTTS